MLPLPMDSVEPTPEGSSTEGSPRELSSFPGNAPWNMLPRPGRSDDDDCLIPRKGAKSPIQLPRNHYGRR
jgi:hypothetical protein